MFTWGDKKALVSNLCMKWKIWVVMIELQVFYWNYSVIGITKVERHWKIGRKGILKGVGGKETLKGAYNHTTNSVHNEENKM